MPDLATHALTGHAIHRVSGGRLDYTCLLAGSMLPDVVSWLMLSFELKAERLGLLPSWPERFFPPMHSFVLVAIWCGLVALWFVKRQRGVVFSSLLLAAEAHVLLDLLQEKYDGGYLFLYPFYWKRVQIGLLPQDDWFVWLAIAAFLVMALEIARRLRKDPAPA